jgi:hypothetical protein
MGNQEMQPHSHSKFLLYTASSGKVSVDVFIQEESVWLTQKALAELFGKERSVITKHIKNIVETGELDEKSTVQKMHISGSDKPERYYNLDLIIAVGYRVNSYQATQFRMWATKTLKEFIVKGFVLDDKRLKQGKTLFGKESAVAWNVPLKTLEENGYNLDSKNPHIAEEEHKYTSSELLTMPHESFPKSDKLLATLRKELNHG